MVQVVDWTPWGRWLLRLIWVEPLHLQILHVYAVNLGVNLMDNHPADGVSLCKSPLHGLQDHQGQ
jgi:hypothetical protein